MVFDVAHQNEQVGKEAGNAKLRKCAITKLVR
jgi:hypothetical protein